MAVQDSKSPVAANISQSSVTYPTCSKMTSVKEEQPQLKLLSKKELPELSKFCISDDGGTKCNTLCSIGEDSSVMQQNSVKETNLPNDNGIFPNIESNLNKQQPQTRKYKSQDLPIKYSRFEIQFWELCSRRNFVL